MAGAIFIFGNTNCVTFLFSKSLNEFLLAVLYRNTFDKVVAATELEDFFLCVNKIEFNLFVL